jgi:hypothetical protein
MPVNSTPVADLAADCRAKRERLEILKASHQAGQASYAAMHAAAVDFCLAFDRYHKAKHGKAKRLDPRYVIRSL